MKNQTFLTFRVDLQTFSLPVDVVVRVVRLPALTMLAEAPPAIAGLLNLHGHLIPVLIGHMLLNQPGSVSVHSFVIVTSHNIEQPVLGLIVDEVYDVVTVSADRFVPLAYENRLLCASLRINDRSYWCLNHRTCLSGPDCAKHS
ncbi:chemotaxis protein CheW [Chloroflexus sp.]|uniref:chemotaxis protein CheW n=1 Tax=Chloroflexus sp. TaxID=1904827 RepID=UPI002ADE229C|nr:chemotaxis protein CheW [Chloroflexus sp.]